MRIGLHTSPGVAHSSPGVVHTSLGVVHTSPGVVHTSPGVVHTSPGVVHTSPGVVHTSSGVVHTSPGVVHTSPGVVHTSPGVVHTSPRLVLPNQGARRNSRRVVKRTSRSIRLGRRSEAIMLKKAANCLENTLFARVYYIRLLFPEKSIHPFTQSAFPVEFHRFPV